MKSILITLFSLIIVISCDPNNNINETTVDENYQITGDENLITGKWIHTEAYISAGGPQYWVDVENGEEIDFFENGTFSSNRFNECDTGNYSITGNELLLKYNCDGFNPESENEEGFITYKLDFSSDYFILTPTSGAICIEGCSSKYQKKK